MDRWLVGLVVAAIALPLIIFVGNLKVEVPEGGEEEAAGVEGSQANAAEAVVQEENTQAVIPSATAATTEIYFGYEFARVNLGNEQGFVPGEVVSYSAPESYSSPTPNIPYVEGEWRNNPDNLELVSDEGRILLKYTAKAVNVVAGQGVIPSVVYVSLDAKPANSTNKGSDVTIAKTETGGAVAVIDEQRLYNVVNDNSYSTRVLELAVTGKGFRIYTFTFG